MLTRIENFVYLKIVDHILLVDKRNSKIFNFFAFASIECWRACEITGRICNRYIKNSLVIIGSPYHRSLTGTVFNRVF